MPPLKTAEGMPKVALKQLTTSCGALSGRSTVNGWRTGAPGEMDKRHDGDFGSGPSRPPNGGAPARSGPDGMDIAHPSTDPAGARAPRMWLIRRQFGKSLSNSGRDRAKVSGTTW
jgi:hypothetical protein